MDSVLMDVPDIKSAPNPQQVPQEPNQRRSRMEPWPVPAPPAADLYRPISLDTRPISLATFGQHHYCVATRCESFAKPLCSALVAADDWPELW
jgi:hypothetical protein